MIASGTVDAIITTVPHYLHHEISIYAMEHGMNVLCEKPAGCPQQGCSEDDRLR